MIKTELIQRIAAATPHLYERDVTRIVDSILDNITEALSRDDRVELRGFGTFSVRTRPAHVGRNPRTGIRVSVPETRLPFFKTAREMRKRVNNGVD
jgi:integration host factor subunit beta